MREDLLRPSLTNAPPVVGLYSIVWSLLPGFFLGPLPVILYSALNSYRLRRWMDVPVYLLAFAGVIGVLIATSMNPPPETVQWFAQATGVRQPMYTMMRVYAVVLWGGFYLLHRKQHRSSSMLTDLPPAWIACLVSTIVGVGITYGTAHAIDFVTASMVSK
jgi:hypothetical protein